MARGMTAQQFVDKWAANSGSSGTSFVNGVQAVTESPMEKAAANPNKYLQGVQASVQSGKWANSLKSVSLAEWKRAMIDKGQARISSGVTQAKPKMLAFAQAFLPVLAANRAQVLAMPSDTKPQRIQRAVRMMELNGEFSYKG